MLTLLFLLLCSSTAFAGPHLHIDARVHDNLRWISGTLQVKGNELDALQLQDRLSDLPVPADHLSRRRQFPARITPGVLGLVQLSKTTWRFYALLPRRFGDIGATAHGLFANGHWHPHPTDRKGDPLEVDWTVQIQVPQGTSGVIGNRIAEDNVTWSGTGEYVSLAVLKRAHVTALGPDAETQPTTQLVTSGRPRRSLVRRLNQLITDNKLTSDVSAVLVEAPLRDTLLHQGHQLNYISDRAFRITAGLQSLHDKPIARALMVGQKPVHKETQEHIQLDAEKIARWTGWMPPVDLLVTEGSTPFLDDMLPEANSEPTLEAGKLRKLQIVAAAWPTTIQLTEKYVDGFVSLGLHPKGELRWQLTTGIFRDRSTRFGAVMSFVRRVGEKPEIGLRPHRLALWLSPSWLDANFASTEQGDSVVEGGLSYAWDNRIDNEFPTDGLRVYASLNGGLLPQTGKAWLGSQVNSVALAPLHPAAVLAFKVSLAHTTADLPHRQWSLGGSGALRSLPQDATTGKSRCFALAELRLAPVRHASIPAGLAWGRALYLSGGIEAGLLAGRLADVFNQGNQTAVGATAGIAIAGDVLGLSPQQIGITLAKPIWSPSPAIDKTKPQWYLRWWQEF